jgi:hypothetical protein
MRIELDDLKKLELGGSTATAAEQFSPDDIVTAILKVKRRNYVPKEVKLRSRVDDLMFTGELAARELKKVESDNNVVSVAVSKRLRRIE